ncbi:hypothetical protein [Swaminathania salitolerans]|uniref:DUF3995 domain-containing protein n=1 Tax=Swaminathania salitolerans TaxID=182838 RepID=A0A511BNB7_9PROT|nr:hypothetical protein [Swaminathania salitolerans]GBQ13763.1 hypothetical protein AA21291_1613 [Swaminathania salitolerans LMG 21291]GEL01745.1 hypothetical protein SSA02_09080 [Swaminathania salitolerans]
MRKNRLSRMLVLAACCSFAGALLHLGCIWFGAAWYRWLGAGEAIARMAAAGEAYPTVITLCIAGILLVWGGYALSGAGVLPRLPLLRIALCAITAFYLLRGLAFAPMQIWFPGRSTAFWWWSSTICFTFGVLHLAGLRQVWSRIQTRDR